MGEGANRRRTIADKLDRLSGIRVLIGVSGCTVGGAVNVLSGSGDAEHMWWDSPGLSAKRPDCKAANIVKP